MIDLYFIAGALLALLALSLLVFVELPARARQVLGVATIAGIAGVIWRALARQDEQPAEPTRPPAHETTDEKIADTDARIDGIDASAADGLSANEAAAMEILREHDSHTDR